MLKTSEGYRIEKFQSYPNLNVSIYKNLSYSDSEYEQGFCGLVLDTNQDDRFTVAEFCIWNEKGICVYTYGRWGVRDIYKIHNFDESVTINR